eukprot:CAMPEP_0201487140 /NCGR_PEP_ID=MMETSP0151_2-20130828/11136_1 /ASSEMBLY_ACC=CAM_ASM_000257 /TAXON_ID=200890 /ORGANISM="Paramoeba atlantica, Strain 621/1 / CCAP 1560/9" /LENGTH=89 /DNA_ID=CAMNT_0047872117 /DNA_START=224 /DNA_END=493 /DNA_ORIENTATION=-
MKVGRKVMLLLSGLAVVERAGEEEEAGNPRLVLKMYGVHLLEEGVGTYFQEKRKKGVKQRKEKGEGHSMGHKKGEKQNNEGVVDDSVMV